MKAAALLDDVLAARNRIGRPAATTWRGSLLGSCIRRQVYEARGVTATNPPDARTLRVFQRGHVVGEMLTELLTEHPDVLFAVFEVDLLWAARDFSGHPDVLIWFKDGHVELWEVKSTHSQGFRYLGDTAKADHEIQAAAYAEVLAGVYDIEVDGIRVVYVSADDWRMAEFPVPEGRRGDVRRILTALDYYHSRGRLPPRLRFGPGLDPRKRFPCSYCPFLDACRPA